MSENLSSPLHGFHEFAEGKANSRRERNCGKKSGSAPVRDRTLVIPGRKVMQRVDGNGCRRREVRGE